MNTHVVEKIAVRETRATNAYGIKRYRGRFCILILGEDYYIAHDEE